MTYPLPAAALDDRLAFIGTSGAGKTYSAGTAVEKLLRAKARVVIIDPLDVWWGLRLSSDGEGAGFPLVIFGGAHGDMPLNEHAGALIGETVATMGESCIVSLGGLQTKASERRFMLAFLDAIYRKTDPAKTDPYHIVFDEADLWAPQKSTEPMLQSRMEEIVRRGRIKGFIPWLITQRPAVLSKDVLSQADGLIAFKLTSSQDRDAIGAWIEGQADRVTGRSILNALPMMARGQGVVWLPGRDILETATFPEKVTFDSSRTPARGERARTRELKPLNLDRLKSRLASLEEETKANDPKALRAEIADLKRKLAKAEKAAIDPPAPVIANADAIEAARQAGELSGIAIGITRAQAAVNALRVVASAPSEAAPKVAPTPRQGVPAPRRTADGGLPGPQQRIVDAIAWWEAFRHMQPTNEQAAFIAGYSPSSTGYTNPRGALRAGGLITYPVGNRVALTDQGRAVASAVDAPPTQDELHRRVRAKLPGPQARILDAIMAAYPAALTNAEAASRAGYSAMSTGYTNPRGALRTLSLIDYPSGGLVRAEDWLFPEARP